MKTPDAIGGTDAQQQEYAARALHLVPIVEIKAIVDTLADLGIDPLHMHVDGHKPTDIRPDVQLWMRYRTDFERVCVALGAKRVEVRNWQVGERRFSAEHDTDRRRLLIQCVSFKHHDDYEEAT